LFRNTEELVTFVVGEGENKKNFMVHKEVACRGSPVLEAAFNSTFIEGQTQTYALDADKDVCRMFVQWLYTRKVKLLVHHEDLETWTARLPPPFSEGKCTRCGIDDKEHDDTSTLQNLMLLKLWVLADNLLIPSLKHYVVQILCSLGIYCYALCSMHLEYIYDITLPGDALRKLVVDQRCYSIRAGEDPKVDVYTPHQMLLDIVDRLNFYHGRIPGVARGSKEKYFDAKWYLLRKESKNDCGKNVGTGGVNSDVGLKIRYIYYLPQRILR
jgi:hypothetical protein